MKNKKKMGLIIFEIVCIVIVIACIIIQIIIKDKDKKLEKESQKYENLTIETKSGTKVETEYIHIDNEKFYLKVPKSFKQLDYETITAKYNGDIPNIVFSNDETTINVAVSLNGNEMKNDQIKEFLNIMKKTLKDNSEILGTDFYEIDNHNVGKIKLISKGQDTDIYNNMIFFSYNNELVIIAFNCTTELQNEWQSVGDFIIDSLFFKE